MPEVWPGFALGPGTTPAECPFLAGEHGQSQQVTGHGHLGLRGGERAGKECVVALHGPAWLEAPGAEIKEKNGEGWPCQGAYT